METTIVEGKYVVTMDNARRIIENGSVVIENDTIIDVGKSEDMKKKYNIDDVIGGKKCMVIPGLVDVHSHAFQCLFRGLGDDNASGRMGG